MRVATGRAFSVLMVLLAAVLVCSSEAQSQRRSRRSRRAATPMRSTSVPVPTPLPTSTPTATAAAATDPTLVSSAEDAVAQDAPSQRQSTRRTTGGRAARRNAAADAESDQEQLQRTVNKLTDEVTKLSQDITVIKGEQRTLVDLERLTRAEQRAEGLRAQLRDVTDKEFAFAERAAQIEDELQPDAIERRAALTGSLRPSDVRDQIRRGLERERERVRAQREMLSNSRVRLESAIATADLEVEKIKRRIDAADREQTEAGANAAGHTTAPAPNLTNPPATETTPVTQSPPPPDDR